jgi:hypothetical protein
LFLFLVLDAEVSEVVSLELSLSEGANILSISEDASQAERRWPSRRASAEVSNQGGIYDIPQLRRH